MKAIKGSSVGITLAALVSGLAAFMWAIDQNKIEDLFVSLFGQQLGAWLPIAIWVPFGLALIALTAYMMFWHDSPKKRARRKNIPCMIIAVFLSSAIVVMTAPAHAAESVPHGGGSIRVSVSGDGTLTQAEQDYLVQEALARLGDAQHDTFKLSSDDMPGDIPGDPQPVIKPAKCCTQIVVVTIVVAGVIIIAIKVIKACKKIADRRQKKIDDADPDSGSGTNKLVAQKLPYTSGTKALKADMTVYAAQFVVDVSLPTAEDDADCGCDAPFCFTFTAGEDGTRLDPYLPDKLIGVDDYLVFRGLSTNSESVGDRSFSINNIPVDHSDVIRFENGIISVNIPGQQSVTNIVQSSTNLTDWVSVYTNCVPLGSQTRFSDSATPASSAQKFWRVIRAGSQ